LYGANILWLDRQGEIKQEFMATYPGLDQIDIFVTGPQVGTTPVTLSLRPSCGSSQELRQSTAILPAGVDEGRLFYSFTFDPLDDSANLNYCFQLESQLSGEAENGLGVWASQTNAYPEGRGFYKPPPRSNSVQPPPIPSPYRLFLPLIQANELKSATVDIAFQLHYAGLIPATLSVFLKRLVEYKPFVFGSVLFYGGVFLFYLVGVGRLLRFAVILKDEVQN
jgi:hypothetical protein